MATGPDPLGKRALYWLPVDEQAVEGDGYQPRGRTPVGTDTVRLDPDRRHARPTGKHALFSSATPAGDEEDAEDLEMTEEPQPPQPAKKTFEATGKIKLTTQDHRFLRALKIAVDDDR